MIDGVGKDDFEEERRFIHSRGLNIGLSKSETVALGSFFIFNVRFPGVRYRREPFYFAVVEAQGVNNPGFTEYTSMKMIWIVCVWNSIMHSF